MKKIIAIIGDRAVEKGGTKYKMAYEVGRMLVDHGYRVQSGGLGGVMQAAFEGARSSENYKEGATVALVPSFDVSEVNPYADIVIPTGLDILRNALVANASAVVAIGGGAGTLSEMALAWQLKRMLIAFDNVEGWSKKLAGQRLDENERSDNADDKVFAVSSAKQAVELIDQHLHKYNRYHTGIKGRKEMEDN